MEYKTINFKVTSEEYDLIKDNAKLSDKTLVAYAKEVLINRASLDFDYESIREHTNELSELRKELNKVLHTIMDTEEAYNADIQTILLLMKEIMNSEKEFLKQMEKDREQKKKEVKKTIKKLVDKQLIKEGDKNVR